MATPVTEITTTANSPLPPPRQTTSMTFYIWTICLGLFTPRRGENWRYSLPVVVIKTIWNLAFVAFSVVTLILTVNEKLNVPLRGWISVSSMHCVVRVLLPWLEYTKRNSVVVSALFRSSTRLESLDPVFSEFWQWIGYFWVSCIDETPPHDAPRLYWLTLAFLAPGIFFAYIRAHYLLNTFQFIKKGASDADISILPKYRFEVSNDEDQADCRAFRMVPMLTNGPEFSAERVLQTKDADCCICLCNYEDGGELYSLPCNHHFHTGCIRKWLMLKASCPLCKREMNR